MAVNQLGKHLRLWGLSMAEVPGTNASVGDLRLFVMDLLREAIEFISSVDDYYADPGGPGPWKSKGKKRYKGEKKTGGKGVVKVDLLERIVSAEELRGAFGLAADKVGHNNDNANSNGQQQEATQTKDPRTTPETWFCRRSNHIDSPAAGTGSEEEFRRFMKDEHVSTERAMTPTVVATQKAIVWPNAEFLPEIELLGGNGSWGDFTLAVVEMQHKIGRPILQDRVFPVLQMTCLKLNQPAHPEYLVVSVTINDWATVHPPAGIGKLASGSKIVLGSYVSVERFRHLPVENNPNQAVPEQAKPMAAAVAAVATAAGAKQPAVPAKEGLAQPNQAPTARIEWTMATASHARGVLPLFLQNPAVPGKIAEDVPLFLKWLEQVRALQRVPETEPNAVPEQPPAQSSSADQGQQPANDQPANDNQSASVQPASGQPASSQSAT